MLYTQYSTHWFELGLIDFEMFVAHLDGQVTDQECAEEAAYRKRFKKFVKLRISDSIGVTVVKTAGWKSVEIFL